MALVGDNLMNLPVEIPAEILAKLHDKSLIRMTCVCKALHDLIMTNPKLHEKYMKIEKDHYSTVIFFRRLLNFQGSCERFLLSHDSRKLLSVEFQHVRDFESNAEVSVLGWCNGILLCSNFDPIEPNVELNPGTLFFHNPITRQVLQIPPILSRADETVDSVGCLDDCGACFGFDPSSNDYKIILIRPYRENGFLKRFVEIYKVSTNCWSKLDVDYNINKFENYHLKYMRDGGGVNLNGFFNGIVRQSFSTLQKQVKEKILTFDFSSEKFGVIKYPVNPWKWKGILHVLDDSLALGVRLRQLAQRQSNKFNVWVMTECGKEESWTKKFSIELSGGLHSKVLAFWVRDMNLVVLSGDRDYNEDFDGTKGGWFGFLQEDGNCKELNEHRGFAVFGFAFRPSLVSLSSLSSMCQGSTSET